MLPTDWNTLAALVLLLGVKHGFDADHLATIDGLTRLNLRKNRYFARWCGLLFSLGHGGVVVAIAMAVALASATVRIPTWLGATGVWISIACLVVLGVVNLRAVLLAPADAVVAPLGLKGRFLGRFTQAQRPALVAGVGALFALSYDTVSQAALFALTSVHFGGLGYVLALGLLFTFGMIVTDAVNGIWIAALMARADDVARVASRVMSLAIACVSLLVATFSTIRLLSPRLEAWSSGHELWLGGAVCLIVFVSYLLGRLLTQLNRRYSRDLR